MSVGASRARRLWNVLTTTPTQRDQVDRAARHLDVTRSTWYRDVDLGTLDMNHPGWCVLGQLYGDYEDGRRALYGPFHDAPTSSHLDARRAFYWSFPRRLWIVEVLRRRAAEAVAASRLAADELDDDDVLDRDPEFLLLHADPDVVGRAVARAWGDTLERIFTTPADGDVGDDLPSLAPDLPDVARRELLDANDRGETFAELADRIRRLP